MGSPCAARALRVLRRQGLGSGERRTGWTARMSLYVNEVRARILLGSQARARISYSEIGREVRRREHLPAGHDPRRIDCALRPTWPQLEVEVFQMRGVERIAADHSKGLTRSDREALL